MDDTLIDALAALPDDEVLKAVMHAKTRNALPDSDFAYIDSTGGRHLPINDAAHARNALARFNQTHFESEAKKATAWRKILAACKTFGIEVSDDANVKKADDPAGDTTVAGLYVEITKADAIEGIIYGVASVANLVDRQGDVIRPDELRKAAHDFLAHYRAFNDTHTATDIPGDVVESWIDGDTWRVAFRPADLEVAKAAAQGDFVGLSIEGEAKRVPINDR